MPVLFLNMRIKLLALSKGLVYLLDCLGTSQMSDCGVFVAAYVEFFSDGLQIPYDKIISQSLRLKYASLLWNYGILKARSGYVSSNEDPQRPRPKKAKFIDENIVVITID
ncbi:hypothetical protein H5410_037096 [Solanum commersonii]|uniref:Ulp1 protease family, C-terminal catalytic domain containing protein n=1 Tax=Solanum commersonii TaxID=4109 RepID=A0A9J5Y8I8_SOLCO|nr:hypothetical protein H5410_037096 [Solanum commersonii]